MARNDNCQVVIADVIRNPSDIYTFYGSSHRLVCVSSYNIYSNIEHGQWAPNMSLRFSIWLGAFMACVLAVLVLALLPSPPPVFTTGWDKSNHLLAACVFQPIVEGWWQNPQSAGFVDSVVLKLDYYVVRYRFGF